jgi:hypothetical protein
MRRVTSTPPSRNDKVVLTNSANQVCLNVQWIFSTRKKLIRATEHRSTDQSRNGCGMCCFCHAQPFEITRAKNIKNPFVQRSRQNAKVVEAFCSRRVHHRDRPQRTIPIALAAVPGATLPRLRALALFGRRPLQRVDSLLMPASENLHNRRHSPSNMQRQDRTRYRRHWAASIF